jgi:lipoprotein-anchoring transpeptidase ErfK/SrfK
VKRALVLWLLVLPLIGSAASGQATPTKGDLTRLFAAARAESSGVVPLRDASVLADTLEPYSRRAFFGPERLPEMERLGLRVHVVAPGELPGEIARRYGFGAGLLKYLNQGYDERKLRAGQELKVLDLTDKSLSIVVTKSTYRMSIWRTSPDRRQPLLIAHFPVGLGAESSPTPTGDTRVTKRVLDPEWTHPETREVIAPHDPRNILGGYWIALDPEGIGRAGIGFHGFTGDVPKNWIEQPASHGCVRLLQPDIDRVFQLALDGTRVSLRP